ncbi:hypothetical protein H5410_057830 [Solanum commersonii]|uniref:Uncharacterized protein n=1 Tax=Solanum commersonii TaxID=4109 RepID=A0A9J5WRQ6_SOLCO|nr:hypothetical protein H5410_057830 [Solanum commersonii]
MTTQRDIQLTFKEVDRNKHWITWAEICQSKIVRSVRFRSLFDVSRSLFAILWKNFKTIFYNILFKKIDIVRSVRRWINFTRCSIIQEKYTYIWKKDIPFKKNLFLTDWSNKKFLLNFLGQNRMRGGGSLLLL